jgi:hypothetical protein
VGLIGGTALHPPDGETLGVYCGLPIFVSVWTPTRITFTSITRALPL